MNYTAKLRKTPPPAAAATENDPMVLDEGGVLAAGGRPAPLSEVAGRQLRVERHCGVGFELVQALDVPVLQMVEQPVEVDTFFRLSLPSVVEQVIEVPKLALPVCAVQRAALPEPQLVEQLVEVPTVLSVAVLQQRTAEQIIGFPVPGRGGGARGGLQGLSQGQGSTAVCGAENVDTPVPHGRGRLGGGGLHGLSQGQGSTALCGAVTSTFPFLMVVLEREVFKVFPEDRVPQRLPLSRPSLLIVFKVFPEDRVPQRLPLSRPSVLIVEVFKVFPVDRVPQRLPLSRLFLRLLIDGNHEPRFMAVMTSGCAWLMWSPLASAGMSCCRWTSGIFPLSDHVQMLCILAGMDQKDTYVVGFGGDDASRAVFFFRVRGAPVPVH